MHASAITHVGLVRSENQDRVKFSVLCDGAAVVVVCDGMGGENAGGEASEIACGIIYERLVANYRADADLNSIRNLILTSISAANSVVFEKSLADEFKTGMGTTCVCAIIRSQIACIASVGDSRAYIINDAQVMQITNDHTIVRMLVERGQISEADAKNHPDRNKITRAVGIDEKIDADYFEIDFSPGSVVLMCTDGLSGYCTNEKLKELVVNKSLDQATTDLVSFAIEQGGKDNITVALVSDKIIRE